MLNVFGLTKKRETTQDSTRYVTQMKGLYNESVVISDQLVAAVDEVDQAMTELSTIADCTEKQEQELSSNSKTATHKIAEAFSSLQEVSASADQIGESATHLTIQSSDTKKVTLEMQQSIENSASLMQQLQSSNIEMSRQIEALIANTSKIYELNHLIQEIVAQTSLLALNASIEAAHAGEYGRGFSVVATEIRRLADQSNASVKQTTELVNQIEEAAKLVTSSVEKERQAVERGTMEMTANRDRMNIITERITEVDSLVHEMKESSFSQNKQTNIVIERLEEAVEYVNRTLVATESTLKMNRSQRKQITKLDRIRDNLGNASAALKQSIETVEIDVLTKVANTGTDSMLEWLKLQSVKPELRSLQYDEHFRVLQELLKEKEDIEAIWSNDADGAFIISFPTAGLLNAKGRSWWQHAMKGEVYQSNYYVSAITKKLCQTLSVPIRDDQGNIVGVLGIDLSVDNN